MSTFLDEIRQNPVMQAEMRDNPEHGAALLAYFTKAYAQEWNDFISERDRLRHMGAQVGMGKLDVRQVACFPPFIGQWLKFINVGNIPEKDFLRKFLREHPVFWVRENAFTRR